MKSHSQGSQTFWNELPEEIRAAELCLIFEIAFKTHFLKIALGDLICFITS